MSDFFCIPSHFACIFDLFPFRTGKRWLGSGVGGWVSWFSRVGVLLDGRGRPGQVVDPNAHPGGWGHAPTTRVSRRGADFDVKVFL